MLFFSWISRHSFVLHLLYFNNKTKRKKKIELNTAWILLFLLKGKTSIQHRISLVKSIYSVEKHSRLSSSSIIQNTHANFMMTTINKQNYRCKKKQKAPTNKWKIERERVNNNNNSNNGKKKTLIIPFCFWCCVLLIERIGNGPKRSEIVPVLVCV